MKMISYTNLLLRSNFNFYSKLDKIAI